MAADRFASIDYRALIDWNARLAREWPFLDRALAQVPSRRLLDLGCGPGEHAALLASHGFEVVGVDASPSMLETARGHVVSDRVSFVAADLTKLDDVVEGNFGGAICVGNTLPSIRTRADLARMLKAVRHRLLQGGVLALQLLNYEKILSTNQRHLPLTLRPSQDGWLVFLRLMEPRPGGDLIFSPTVLRYRPDGEPMIAIEGSERVEVHGWTRAELDGLLEQAGFATREYYGSVGFAPYDAAQSSDLVVVAR
ncbi:MAG: class I SAM-dependent methyltransferase [Bacteroidales bacterium]